MVNLLRLSPRLLASILWLYGPLILKVQQGLTLIWFMFDKKGLPYLWGHVERPFHFPALVSHPRWSCPLPIKNQQTIFSYYLCWPRRPPTFQGLIWLFVLWLEQFRVFFLRFEIIYTFLFFIFFLLCSFFLSLFRLPLKHTDVCVFVCIYLCLCVCLQ